MEDNGPSIARSRADKSNGGLREVLRLFLSLSIPLSHSVLSLSPQCAMGNPLRSGFFCTCVSDQKTENTGGGGWRVDLEPCVWLQTPHCFSAPPPFLHSSLLSQGRQLNKEVLAFHPFFLLRSLINAVALGRFFLFVSIWQAEDTVTQNTPSFLTLSL